MWEGDKKIQETDKVSVLFSYIGEEEITNIVFLKHGEPDSVRKWAQKHGRAFKLVTYTGKFNVNELNWLLQCHGYTPYFLEKHNLKPPVG